MQIILLEKIANVGNLGDIVKVKNGFARNFLIPQGKAKRATEANVKLLEEKRVELEAAANAKLETAQALGAKLEGLTVKITQKAGVDGRLFGSVTNVDIVEALRSAGPQDRKGDDPHARGPAEAGRRLSAGDRAAPRRRGQHHGVRAGRYGSGLSDSKHRATIARSGRQRAAKGRAVAMARPFAFWAIHQAIGPTVRRSAEPAKQWPASKIDLRSSSHAHDPPCPTIPNSTH